MTQAWRWEFLTIEKLGFFFLRKLISRVKLISVTITYRLPTYNNDNRVNCAIQIWDANKQVVLLNKIWINLFTAYKTESTRAADATTYLIMYYETDFTVNTDSFIEAKLGKETT